ncbi:hypothetical protein HDV00_005694 [Rhizophlyctis rosea]|nr:hypothetical protein HDV00_005694 [Rhizophlyctis rosea]
MAATPLRFTLPKVSDNPNGWGPVTVPDELAKIPYAPYSKSDRLGKIADWTAPTEGQYGYDRRYDERQGGRGRYGRTQEVFGSGTASAFAYTHTVEDEQSFSVVDRGSTTQKKPGFKPARGGRTQGRGGAGAGGAAWQTAGRGSATRGGRDERRGQQGQRRRYGYNDKQTRVRDASIVVGAEWKVVEELDFPRLNKLQYNVEEPEDLQIYGSSGYYDKSYDRVSTKQERALQNSHREYPSVTTSDDPVINDLSKEESEGFTVYATDTILAALMTASRSVYSWDIVVTKQDDKLFLDKRDGSNLDLVNVNENAADPPMESTEKDAINTPIQLALEASKIISNLTQQVVKDDEPIIYTKDSPLSDLYTDPAAPAIYRYRQWSLGEGTSLVVRTQIDAALHQPTGATSESAPKPSESKHPATETLLVNVRALNEFDSRAPGSGGAPDWRQKLDSQRGAVMATEIKNNSNKLARWTVESVLSGAHQMRLAFVSRTNPKSSRGHVVLGTASFKPREFAAQMNYNLGNGWGVVKTFVDLCQNRLEDGKYILVKDPNKPVLRLYSVPQNAFDVIDEPEEELEAEVGEEDM